jgi:hypothetical protein
VLPVVLVPDTVGFDCANGPLVIAAVEAVNRTVEPKEFVAVMRAIRCLPTSSLLSIRVLVLAPVTVVQPEAAIPDAATTSLVQLNHWYV